MTAKDESGRQSWHWLFTGWRGAVAALVVVVVMGLASLSSLTILEHEGLFPDRAGRTGIIFNGPGHAPGWGRVGVAESGSGAEEAGIVPGDEIRSGHPLRANSSYPPGTKLDLMVRHNGKERKVTVVYHAFDPTQDLGQTARSYGTIFGILFSAALAAVVMVRGWGQPSAVALGLGLLASGTMVPAWAIDKPWTNVFVAVLLAAVGMQQVALLAVVPLLYVQHVRQGGRAAVTITVLLLGTLYAGFFWYQWLSMFGMPEANRLRSATYTLAICAVGSAVWWAWRGYRDSPTIGRNRFAALLAAFAILVVGEACFFLSPDLSGKSVPISFVMADLIQSVLFPLLLAYAVLRHRVIDISFAVNRTVVYGIVSAILLGAFGLIEWGFEHLLPEELLKASAWFDAGAAVMVYLAFHRVHDAVEKRVEHLFFHHWQANEEALRRFVGSAAHFEDAGVLAKAFADELSRFGGGARVAIYRRGEGALERVAGGWEAAPKLLAGDDPAFALMRAERRPIDLTDTRTDLPGVLALPMLDHGALAGLTLMDVKNGDALYRPDEVVLLGWAAHEVGLALAALRARATDAQVRLLEAQLAELRRVVSGRQALAGA